MDHIEKQESINEQQQDGSLNEAGKPVAIVIGATGLVGRELVLQLLYSGYYTRVYIVVRKPFELLPCFTLTDPEACAEAKVVWVTVPDFADLKQALATYDLTGADAFSALGTTQKIAGSKEAFYTVDHDYNLAFAEITYQQGARHYLLVSAMGADPYSFIFYNKVKGRLEVDVQQIGFKRVSIFRPSLLIGARPQEKRLAEEIGQGAFKIIRHLMPARLQIRPIEAKRVAQAMSQVALIKSTAFSASIHQIAEQMGTKEHPTAQVQFYANRDMLAATLKDPRQKAI